MSYALIITPDEAEALCERLDIALGFPKTAARTDRYTDFTVNGEWAIVFLNDDVWNYLSPAERFDLLSADDPEVAAFFSEEVE